LSHSAPAEPLGPRTIFLAVLISILWGGNIVSIRIGVDSVPPLWSAFWRMLTGVIFVSIWARGQGLQIWPARQEWPALFRLGVLFTLQIGLLNSGAALTSPAYAVVLLNSYAVFANITGHFFTSLEGPLTRNRIIGLTVALIGLGILAVGQKRSDLAPQPLLGSAMLIGSSCLLGIRQVYTRWLVQGMDPVRTVIWQMAWSVPLFLVIAVFSEPPVYGRGPSWQAIAAIGYQGIVVAGVCFIVWASLLQRHTAGKLSMFAFLVPICGILLSAMIFNEPIQLSLVTGGAFALTGVFIVSREEH
jgi:O-acetylserine/cysteine efflux transporter